MQARRRAQPSGTNSPSSSHPRLKHRARCVIFCRARHAAARVAPEKGTWQARILEPRGSAPRERDHRGGDHPVPSRTRQLSPPSPRVLQREAAGGQGVALAEGAFLYAPGEARRGMLPLRAFSALWEGSSLRGGASFSAPTGPGCGPSCVRVGRCRRRMPTLEPEDSWGYCKSILHNGADAMLAVLTLESVYRRNLATHPGTNGLVNV